MQRQIQCLVGGVLLFACAFLLLDPGVRAREEKKEKPKYTTVEKLTEKGYTEKIADTKVSFDMVPIPAGTFMMGSAKDEEGRKDDEGPAHPVEVKGFWMGK